MKRNFTRILAAFALLVFMTPSLAGWGQTRTEVTDVLNRELTGVTGTSYTEWSGKTSNSDAVWAGQSAGGNESIQLRSSNSNSGIISTTSGGTLTSVSVEWNSNTSSGRTLNIYGSNTAYTAATDLYDSSKQGTLLGTIVMGTSTSLTVSDSYQYIGIRSASGALYLTSVNVTWTTGSAPTPTCATPTFSLEAGTYSEAQTVSINCATEGATIYYTTNGENPTTESEVYSSALTISETTTVKAVAVKDGFDDSSIASATYTIAQSVSGYTIDFEQPASLYTDWTFTTITSEVAGTTDVPAHGGLHYGSTDGKTTGTIVTKTAIATPNTLTCYLSKASNNTTSSTWSVEVSSNGTDWTQAGTHSATSMRKGEWVEFTTNLSNYSNVYVRIRYDGTTAVRCIDDVVLNTEAPAVATPVISPESGTFETTQEVTITCATEGATIYYTTNGDDPTNSSSQYTGAFTLTETATVKAIAYNGTVYSTIASATYTKLVINNIEDITSADSYTVKGKIFAKSNKGFVLGDGTGFVYVYKTTNDFNVGDFVKVTGDVTDQYNGIYEFPSSSTITSIDAFDIAAATPTVMTGDAITTFVNYEGAKLSSYVQYEGVLNISTNGNNTYYNITIEGTDVQGSISYPIQDLTSFDGKAVRVTGYYVGKSGSTTTYFNTMLESISTTEPSIIVNPITINATIEGESGTLTVTYENISTINANVLFCDAEGEAATYDWVSATINSSNNVEYSINVNEGAARTAYMKVYVGETYSSLITINQAGFVAIDLRGVTTSLVFNAGDFTASGNGYQSYENVTYTGNNEVEYPGWTLNNVMHSGDYMQMRKNDGEVIIPTILTDYGFTITVVATTNSVFVGVGEDSKENVYTSAETSADVVIKTGSNYAVISTITITPTVPESHTLTINGYTDVTEGTNNKGYYLIASPVTVNPSTVTGMTEGDFDLYSYDDTEELEWRNYETSAFNLEPGKGYLYAKKATTETPNYEFTLTGAPYAGQPIQLIQGWNLIGNPYSTEATVSTESFYRMNPEGRAELIEGSGSVDAMEGIFVIAENDGDEVTFTPSTSSKSFEQVAINLFKNRGTVIDRAIVRFGEGQQLPKFQLNPNNTKIYVTEGNKDYAVVRSAAQGEMPVSFRAAENGTYTLSIETENVEMDYLHLIDNMTGMDVDLLATPNYTFEAKTTDYANRFRLVFSANSIDEQTAEAFAYFNGTNWTVSNTGDATLQVIDITGRTVSSETINGNATVSLNQPAGIYMLRLVNGNDVKVQKVVVR